MTHGLGGMVVQRGLVSGVVETARCYLGDNMPAWTAAAVPGLWMEGYLHEIAATAVASTDL